jgi:hypothetical protein
MKALSLTQPWAQLVVLGEKRWETRGWATRYTGPLLIHAAKTFPRAAKDVALSEPYRARLTYHGWDPVTTILPVGAVIGSVYMVGCQAAHEVAPRLDAQERAFGDYGPRRYAFALTNPKRLLHPVPWRGQLGIFDMPAGWTLPEDGSGAV